MRPDPIGSEQWLLYSIGGDGRILEHNPAANALDSVDLSRTLQQKNAAKGDAKVHYTVSAVI
jgi:hypothetical protein